jgi:tellurite resistance protein TerC
MTPEGYWWIGFNLFVLVLLALDLGVFHRDAHVVHVREALIWSGVWVTLAMLFGLGIFLGWFGAYGPERQGSAALEFVTGYLIEYSLSVDNVFVFALLFRYFHVPPLYQHRILFWGIIGALVMRAAMIFAGIALLQRFHWIIYVFGAILIFSGIKMWSSHGPAVDPTANPVLRLLRRTLPVSKELHGGAFFVREGGRLAVTPLFIVLLFVEWSDVVFAVDSIPAILAVTEDSFIVYTSNIMAILGLAVLLVFIGSKMLIAEFYKIPTAASLAVIACVLGVSVAASLLRPPPPLPPPESPAT